MTLAPLHQGLKQMGVSTCVEEPLERYLNLLMKWNKTYNLTAIRKLSDMVEKHLLDSLAILPFIKGECLLDVGTGAGLPGIPLAIACPHLHVVLLDSNSKKTRFLAEVKRQLKLDNIEIIHARVENYHFERGFDTVTSRAFATLTQMTTWTQHLLAEGGQWLAMKGKDPIEELKDLNYPHRTVTLKLPTTTDDRCLVIIQRNNTHG